MLRGLSLSLSLYITHITIHYILFFESRTSSLPAANISDSSGLLHLPLQTYGNCCLDYEEQCGRKTCELCGSPLSKFRGGDIASDCAVTLNSVVRVLVDGNFQTALRMVLRRVDKLGPCEEQL